MNAEKFKTDLAHYESNLSKSLPQDKVDLMLHSYCMGFLDSINQMNEEFGSMIMVNPVLEKITELNPKIEQHFKYRYGL